MILSRKKTFPTRHFTVFFDTRGEVESIFAESIYAISDKVAIEYAQDVVAQDQEREWLSNYRYKLFATESGVGVVFVDGSMSRAALMQASA